MPAQQAGAGVARRLAGPALEGAGEVGWIAVTQVQGDTLQRHLGTPQQSQGLALASLTEQLAKAGAGVMQMPLEAAAGQVQARGYFLQVGETLFLAFQLQPHAGADVPAAGIEQRQFALAVFAGAAQRSRIGHR